MWAIDQYPKTCHIFVEGQGIGSPRPDHFRCSFDRESTHSPSAQSHHWRVLHSPVLGQSVNNIFTQSCPTGSAKPKPACVRTPSVGDEPQSRQIAFYTDMKLVLPPAELVGRLPDTRYSSTEHHTYTTTILTVDPKWSPTYPSSDFAVGAWLSAQRKRASPSQASYRQL